MSRKKSGFFVFQPFVSKSTNACICCFHYVRHAWVYGDLNAHFDRPRSERREPAVRLNLELGTTASIRRRLSSHLEAANDDVRDERRDEEHQQHPGNALQCLNDRPVDLQGPSVAVQ